MVTSIAADRIRSVPVVGEPTDGWRLNHLLERLDDLETTNGLLRAKLNDARDRIIQLESQNRRLRDRLLLGAGERSEP